MNKMLIALAATTFALAVSPAAQAGFGIPSISAKSLVQKTCDGEDAAEYLQERAEARAEAMEEGEGYPAPQASLPQRSSQVSSAPEQPAAETPKKTADASDKTDTKADTKTDPKPETKSETKKADTYQEIRDEERRFRRCGKLQEILLLGRHDPVGPLRVRDRRVIGRRPAVWRVRRLLAPEPPRPGQLSRLVSNLLHACPRLVDVV